MTILSEVSYYLTVRRQGQTAGSGMAQWEGALFVLDFPKGMPLAWVPFIDGKGQKLLNKYCSKWTLHT